MIHGLLSEVRIDAALDNREHGLAVTIERLSFVKMPDISFEPALREREALFGIAEISISRTALIQSHHDVRADDPLGLDIVLRGESVPGAVDVGGESAAVRGKFAYRGEAENLEAAAVSENGSG
jgi:hypothetical protein